MRLKYEPASVTVVTDKLLPLRSRGNVDPSCFGGGGHLGYAVEVDGPTHFCLEVSPPIKCNDFAETAAARLLDSLRTASDN